MISSRHRHRQRNGSSLDRPRIVLIHRYFAPDTPPYATILHNIAIRLAQDGMEVEVLTCQPSYSTAVTSTAPARERINNHVSVRRWPVLPDRSSGAAKIANLIMFGGRVIGRLATTRRVDAVMAASSPPVVIAMLASLMAKIKGVPFIYHNQDIYPEVAEPTGELPRPVREVLRRLDTSTDRRADSVVVLSGDMADTIVRRGVDPESIKVINNFDPWTLADRSTDRDRVSLDGIIRFVYAGNLGRFQNLEAVARAIAALGDDERFRFDFIGDGPVRGWLERFAADHGMSHVRVHGYLPPDELADRLRTEYDVGLLSLHPGVIRCAYPSKMMTYLRNGLPVLALVEPDTELVELVARYKAGWSANADGSGDLARALEELWQDRDMLPMMQDQARAMYETEFAPEHQLLRWSQLFGAVTRRSS